MAAILRKLRLREISFVDKGANPGARVVLMKRDKVGEKQMPSKQEKVEKAGLESLVELSALGLSDEQKQAVLALLEAARGQPAVKPEPPKEPKAEAPKPSAPAQPVQDAAPAPAEEVPTEEPKKEETCKSDVEKKFAEERSAMEKRIAQLEDERDTVTLTKHAESRPYLPMATERQVAVMKAARKLGPDMEKELDEMFDKINKAMEQAPVLKRVGSNAQPENTEKLESIAKKLMEEAKGKGQKLPFALAYKQAAKANPKLFSEEQSGN